MSVRSIGLTLALALGMTAADGETVHSWKFDTSSRAGSVVAPTVASGRKADAWVFPSYVTQGGKGAPVRGAVLIVR